MSAPLGEIAAVADAHHRLLERIAGLSPKAVRSPSRLPTWSVDNVLAHLARNADSHVRRTEAAIAGEVVDQYAGGRAGRDAEIEAGASRPATDIIDDVRNSAARLEDIWHRTPERAWAGITRDVSGRERPLDELPARRWQEVEVHLVDLGIGVSHREWADEFVAAWLPRTRERMARRPPDGVPAPGLEDPRDELAWLYGRFQRDDLPAPPPWG